MAHPRTREASQDTRSIDGLQRGTRHQVRGERVANATAERVDHVFFRKAVGRVVDPLATSALTAVCLEGVLQSRAPRVDQEVAAFQEQIEGLEPIQISTRAGEHRPNFSAVSGAHAPRGFSTRPNGAPSSDINTE